MKALLRTRSLYSRWRAVEDGQEIAQGGHGHGVGGREEQEWSATELRNALRSIEWDLEDLDDTVQIVERNPTKFRISASELAARKAFIVQTREEVDDMKARAEAAAGKRRGQGDPRARLTTKPRLRVASSP